ncbi:MAG TPA: alpha-ribazole phosphatase family protein [Gammaproteobacteria bacterium]|nr:alpha-ribazole phosphatase family protein [Gammaproteobacteria bacterium]
MSELTRIDLLRHGEPEGGQLLRGWRDDPLSPRGLAQLRAAVPAKPPWQGIMTSPLRRCAAFAETLAGELALPLADDADLREAHFGAWEGRSPADLLASDREAVLRFWSDPAAYAPPGGEVLRDFVARVRAGWQRLLTQAQGQHWLLVAHGGVIRVILADVLGVPLNNLFRIDVPYASLSRIEVLHQPDVEFPRLIFHNGRA